MKKNRLLSLITLSFVSLIMLQSWSGGYSGAIVAPATTTGCSGPGCHSTAVAASGNNLTVDVIDPNGDDVGYYLPNTAYTIRIKLVKSFANNAAGFQASIFNQGTVVQAGTPVAGSLTTIANIGGTKVANHSQKDISTLKTGSEVTWEYTWNSPLTAANDIDVEVIVNDANNDAASSNDLIIRKSHLLSKIPFATATEDFSKGIEAIYPNPAIDNLTIKLGSEKASDISIYSITGQLVKQITATGNKVNIDVSTLTNGNYILAIAQDGNFARQQFVKY